MPKITLPKTPQSVFAFECCHPWLILKILLGIKTGRFSNRCEIISIDPAAIWIPLGKMLSCTMEKKNRTMWLLTSEQTLIILMLGGIQPPREFVEYVGLIFAAFPQMGSPLSIPTIPQREPSCSQGQQGSSQWHVHIANNSPRWRGYVSSGQHFNLSRWQRFSFSTEHQLSWKKKWQGINKSVIN